MDKFRVLIVDDEVDFVETIVKRLIDRGLEVAGVHSGPEALDLMDNRDFDVVILDVKMQVWTVLKPCEHEEEETPHRSDHADWTRLSRVRNPGASTRGVQLCHETCSLNDLLKQMAQAYERKLIEEERERQSGSEAVPKTV